MLSTQVPPTRSQDRGCAQGLWDAVPGFNTDPGPDQWGDVALGFLSGLTLLRTYMAA